MDTKTHMFSIFIFLHGIEFKLPKACELASKVSSGDLRMEVFASNVWLLDVLLSLRRDPIALNLKR